jgi:hypothetical protein
MRGQQFSSLYGFALRLTFSGLAAQQVFRHNSKAGSSIVTMFKEKFVSTIGLRPTSAVALVLTLAVAALTADGGANHRVSSESYGVSGGNVNDRSTRFCCSGTLGALVKDGSGAFHILSNNHVLARRSDAALGEDISQPGMIDNGCRVAEVVADLSAFAPLGSSNVDAALGALRGNAMLTNGSIEDIGIPSATTAAPGVGMAVAKSGRTTGLTTGSIGSINTTVNVQYQRGCGSGKKFVVGYTTQIVVNSSTFSAGGDSGSLVVTDTPDPKPVGLLFAGSSTTTIANPIGEVLTRLGTALGSTVSFDLTGAGGSAALEGGSVLTAEEITRATRAKDAHADRLMADPSVVGVGVGEDEENPGRAAVVIYLQRGLARAAIARQLDGVATRIVETDPIVAFGWNELLGGSCQPR